MPEFAVLEIFFYVKKVALVLIIILRNKRMGNCGIKRKHIMKMVFFLLKGLNAAHVTFCNSVTEGNDFEIVFMCL